MAKDAAKPQSTRTEFKLCEPVEFNGETVAAISYRRAKGRDIRKALNLRPVGDRYMSLAVDVFEMPEAFFDEMGAQDFMAMTDILDVFFERPLPVAKA